MKVTHHQLCAAPEVALLAAIDHALELAARLVHVAHPELHADINATGGPPLSCDVAPCLIDAIEHLREALTEYHTAIEAELSSTSQVELPF